MTDTRAARLRSQSSRLEQRCPLCGSGGLLTSTRGADERHYSHCGACWLIFVDPQEHLSLEGQAARYRTHQNGIQYPGYVAFLRRIIDPMLDHLDPTMRGLDFGCGPGPTIASILSQYGICCANYDPIFMKSVLEPPYDFIFATECFEHFASPGEEIERLHWLLRTGGYLGIMTEQWTDLAAFRRWYYTRDMTHVSFFHPNTFEYVCTNYGFDRIPTTDARVVVLRKRYCS